VKALTVKDEAEGSKALRDGVFDDGLGSDDHGEAAVSSAGWARNGHSAGEQQELPAVTAELFVEAGAALARRA
jgi:hypothetical protein